MQLTIDEGTIILVAEILKAERGLDRPPVSDAIEAIKAAVRKLKAAGAAVDEE